MTRRLLKQDGALWTFCNWRSVPVSDAGGLRCRVVRVVAARLEQGLDRPRRPPAAVHKKFSGWRYDVDVRSLLLRRPYPPVSDDVVAVIGWLPLTTEDGKPLTWTRADACRLIFIRWPYWHGKLSDR